jgi:heptosyltransferase-2
LKPKLLIIELWGIGDLTIATPFIRKASEYFDVTLLAKPFALEMQERFWPGIKIIPFSAPWTAFSGKYDLFSWPWSSVGSVWHYLYSEAFDVGLSARWDPRDHFLLAAVHARARLGFARMGSNVFLTHSLTPPPPAEHRYYNWQVIARSLKLNLEPLHTLNFPRVSQSDVVLFHTGAAQPVRVWPLEKYRTLIRKMRATGREVRVICNPDQLAWWKSSGEKDVIAPQSITELLGILDHSGVFVGNDSGPGHLAAFCGLPTFSLFGPQMVEWFIPMHPAAEAVEGKPCPYKPCSDYCRFPTPHCLWDITEEEVWPRLERFVNRNLPKPGAPAVPRLTGVLS